MKPNISEFSYGYAVTDELVHGNWFPPIRAAPVFPSLYQEGQAGGGYDVMLDFGGALLFVQFKLSDCMTRRSAAEVQQGLFHPPFYRMHLRPRRHSMQHDLLLQLDNRGELVYYTAPQFHEPSELNAAFLSRSVISRSVWIRPRQIGPLPDDEAHHVAFDTAGRAYFCSEPKRIVDSIRGSDLFSTIERKVFDGLAKPRNKQDVDELANAVLDIGVGDRRTSDESRMLDAMADRHPLERLALHMSRFANTHVFVVSMI